MGDADSKTFNRHVIDTFRSHRGHVDEPLFDGFDLLLITHRGATTGRSRTTPLVYRRHGDAYVVAASNAGAPDDPQWFRNVVATPEVTVEVGDESFPARARVAAAAERDELFAAHAEAMPNFADYERATTRVIPMVLLERT